MITHELRVAETGSPLRLLILDGNDPVDMASYTAKVYGLEEDGDAWIAEGVTGVTEHPTQTFTAVAASNRLVCNGHKYIENQQVVVSSTTTLPGGLSAATRYYCRNVTPNDFNLSERPNGTPIDITGAGSGTHSIYGVGVVQYDFQTGDVDTVGNYRLEMRLYDGSERPRFVEVVKVVVKDMEAV